MCKPPTRSLGLPPQDPDKAEAAERYKQDKGKTS